MLIYEIGSLVRSDIELFEKWWPRIEEKDEKKLSVEGEYEMLELAERMQARFPDILPPIYSNTSYKVTIIFFFRQTLFFILSF